MKYFSLENLFFGYDNELFNGLNIELDKDQMLCISGPSGCGKSTLLSIIAGFIKAEVKIYLDNQRIDNLPSNQRHIGMVFQDYALFDHLSVMDNICFGIHKNKDKHQIANELIKALSLEGLEKQKTSKLSGGQRQRVAIARSLAIRPKLLLLDEPFCALDIKKRQEARILIAQILEEFSICSILISHDEADLAAFKKAKILNFKEEV